jgi:hypothetical protein
MCYDRFVRLVDRTCQNQQRNLTNRFVLAGALICRPAANLAVERGELR